MRGEGGVSLMSDKFNEWTACEANGHQYERCDCTDNDPEQPLCPMRICVDCDDEYDSSDL